MSATLCENVNGNLVPVNGQFIEPNSYSFTPVGTIISVMGTSAPEGYLVCDGQSILIADYSELAAYFLEQFGSVNYFGGNGITTFAVPDLRGEFLRGTGTNSHTNQGSGEDVGDHQDATTIPNLTVAANGIIFGRGENAVASVNPDSMPRGTTGTYRYYGTSTTKGTAADIDAINIGLRPTNTSVLYCIAAKNLYYTNTPAEPNDSFVLRNKILAFTNNVATVSAPNVTSDTYFFVFYHDSCRETAQDADITVSSGAGQFTFTAKNTPEGQIVVDIMCTNFDQISGGGGGSSVLETDLTVNIPVGGIISGDVYPAGTSLESIIRDLLYTDAVDIIPYAMTSNSAPQGTVTFSAQSSPGDHPAWHAFNRNFGRFWCHNGTSTAWIAYEFPSTVVPYQVSWYPLTLNSSATIVAKIQLWDADSSDWVDAGSQQTYVTSSSVTYAGENSVKCVFDIYKTFRRETTKIRLYYVSNSYGNCSAGYIRVSGRFVS